jgi:hypothetical protein
MITKHKLNIMDGRLKDVYNILRIRDVKLFDEYIKTNAKKG